MQRRRVDWVSELGLAILQEIEIEKIAVMLHRRGRVH
jgi:hypothetical protein